MAQAQRELQPGEHVAWNYGAGQAKGQVVEKITENKKLGSRVFKASPDDPKYLVKSDTSGKEAIKKPETLHKIEQQEDAGGEKEKRDNLKARSSSEERKEAEREENYKKVQDLGKGSVRESAKAAHNKIRDGSDGDDDDVLEDAGEEEDATYDPKNDELDQQDDEAAIEELPTDEEAIAQAEEETKEERVKALGEVDEGDEEEDADRTYDPMKEEDIVVEPVEDEEVINNFPRDEDLLKQMERENKEMVQEVDADADDAGVGSRKNKA